MSEIDELFAKARTVDPVPPGTIDRVAARLGPRPVRIGWAWAIPVTAVLVVWALSSVSTPSPTPEGPRSYEAPRFVAKRFEKRDPGPAPKTIVKRTAPARAPAPAIVVEAPTPIAPVAVTPEPIKTPPAPSGRERIVRYRPRATRELEIDWRTLEQEELSKVVRAIVGRRDRGALLAELDQSRPLSPTLLVARGQLRASAERCDEAVTDFDRALEAGAEEPSRTLAIDGRSVCMP